MKDSQKCCGNCYYFRVHYIKRNPFSYAVYDEIYDGHCIYPRLKRRKKNNLACKYFKTDKTPPEN